MYFYWTATLYYEIVCNQHQQNQCKVRVSTLLWVGISKQQIAKMICPPQPRTQYTSLATPKRWFPAPVPSSFHWSSGIGNSDWACWIWGSWGWCGVRPYSSSYGKFTALRTLPKSLLHQLHPDGLIKLRSCMRLVYRRQWWGEATTIKSCG